MTTINTTVTPALMARAFLAEIWPVTWGEQRMSEVDAEAVKAVFDATKRGRLDEAAFLAGQNDLAFRLWMQALHEIESGALKAQELN